MEKLTSLGQSLPEALETTKRLMVTEALRRCRGSIKEAAALLGVTRESLKHHMRALDIHGADFRSLRPRDQDPSDSGPEM